MSHGFFVSLETLSNLPYNGTNSSHSKRRALMSILFDRDRLLHLLDSLYILTGFRANLFDLEGNDICPSDFHSPFCRKINACAEGHARCTACDTQALKTYAGDHEVCFYRCHAGICEALLPIYSGGKLIAFVSFGQFLDYTPLDEQWVATQKTLDWYPGDLEQLRTAFQEFRRYSDEELSAYVEILESLISSIRMKGVIEASGQTELEKLDLYLDQHYMDKLSLDSISRELQIGRTKLCALAKQLSGGKTLSKLISERRIHAAKTLLLQTDSPISAVGEAVGISDYNYFSKVFHAATGCTPSTFRKNGRGNRSLYGNHGE